MRLHKFPYFILVIPVLWGTFRLLPGEQPGRGLPVVSPQTPEHRTQQSERPQAPRMTDQEKEMLDRFVRHESRFKDHYQSHFSKSNYEYHQYRPAYQHGFELGLDARYRTMDWSGVEPEARRTWDESTMGLWDQYKDAVRYGWEQGVASARK